MLRLFFAYILIIIGTTCLVAHAQEEPPPYVKLAYWSGNLLVDSTVDNFIAVVDQMAGYDGIAVADTKLWQLLKYGYDNPESPYAKNVQKCLTAAADKGLYVIPVVGGPGRAQSPLVYDPNMAAAYGVSDVKFNVQGGVAFLLSDPDIHFENGDLESVENGFPVSWNRLDSTTVAITTDEFHSGTTSIVISPAAWVPPDTDGTGRFSQMVNVKPNKHYHVSCWVRRSPDFNPRSTFNMAVIGHHPDGTSRYIAYPKKSAPATANEWHQDHIVFNSYEFTQVRFYFGAWAPISGKLWIDDLKVEEAGMINLLRSPLCPFVVRNSEGLVYQEGVDYEYVSDPELGKADGSSYKFNQYHQPPNIKILNSLLIKENDILSVDYYYTLLVLETQVALNLNDRRHDVFFQGNMMKLNQLFNPRHFMINYDEVRCGTDGQSMANHISKWTDMFGEINPGAKVWLWDDMFNPSHNAHDEYYLWTGDLTGSWEGLSDRNVMVLWGDPEFGMEFFGEKELDQIISRNYDNLTEWLVDHSFPLRPSKGKRGEVTSFLYTTWSNDYTKLTEFATLVDGLSSSTIAGFVGSRKSKVYHYGHCAAVGQIKPENFVEYSEVPADKRFHKGCPR